MEHGAETAVNTWTAPECPFSIEYSTRVLDDIRLAVVDAFFSLPRGGAEIGGILLGKQEENRIAITGYEALECEHAMGPSFTLSPRDQTSMAEMTARARRNPPDRQPVGWYHSHTRSEILFSETDQDIHKRYFPDPRQIALVLKPHTFEPTRGGFFFREADGSIRGNASYQEFVLEALPVRPMPALGGKAPLSRRPLHEDGHLRVPAPAMTPESSGNGDSSPASTAKEKGPVPITREIGSGKGFAGADKGREPNSESDEVQAPLFTQLKQERAWRAVRATALIAGLMVGAIAGYQTRQYWLPQVISKMRPLLPKEADAYVSLAVADEDGQLNIRWDRNAPAIRDATEAVLQITDGASATRSIRLDAEHMATGTLRYARESERVDVALTATEPDGHQVREQTSFLGKLPGRKEKAEDSQVRKERDALAEKADQLQKDLNFQASKTKKLEKDFKEMHDQMQNEQRRRLENQSADPTKKE